MGTTTHSYAIGSYYTDPKGRLYYVSDLPTTQMVQLEECLSRFDDPAHPVEHRTHTCTWCNQNLKFVRGPFFEILLEGE